MHVSRSQNEFYVNRAPQETTGDTRRKCFNKEMEERRIFAGSPIEKLKVLGCGSKRAPPDLHTPIGD